MSVSNKKRAKQLGVSHGAACNRLRKQVMFHLLQRLSEDICFQCGKKIESVDDLSMEHKIPWLDSDDPVGLFYDLDNIAFSHLKCNIGAARHSQAPHGTAKRYGKHGCRCDACTKANATKKRRRLQRKRYRGIMELPGMG